MDHHIEEYSARDGNVTLHIWTDVEGFKKKNFYITGVPGTAIPDWFRKALGKKGLTDIADFPDCPAAEESTSP